MQGRTCQPSKFSNFDGLFSVLSIYLALRAKTKTLHGQIVHVHENSSSQLAGSRGCSRENLIDISHCWINTHVSQYMWIDHVWDCFRNLVWQYEPTRDLPSQASDFPHWQKRHDVVMTLPPHQTRSGTTARPALKVI